MSTNRRKTTIVRRGSKRRQTMTPVQRKETRKVVHNVLARQLETKFWDTVRPPITIDYGGSLFDMSSGLVQGAGVAQYVGATIDPIALHLNIKFLVGDSVNLMRIIIFQTKTAITTAPSILLSNVGNSTAPLSFSNRTADDIYVLKYDRIISLDTYNPQRVLRIKIPGKRLAKMHFSSLTGVVETGGLQVLVISDSAAVTHPGIEFASRLYFKDA